MGCAQPRQVIPHPILGNMLMDIPAGTQIGDQFTKRDGKFMTDFWIDVLNARIKFLEENFCKHKKWTKEDALR
jgi:hypothetical protein